MNSHFSNNRELKPSNFIKSKTMHKPEREEDSFAPSHDVEVQEMDRGDICQSYDGNTETFNDQKDFNEKSSVLPSHREEIGNYVLGNKGKK